MTVSGDLLWHTPTWQTAAADSKGGQKYNFAPMFGSAAPVLKAADVSICHEEVPLAPPGTAPASYPAFAAPRQVARAIADVGFDACTTASNHSWDRGFAGVRTTLDELDKVHVAHAGTARSAAEAARPTIITASNGLRLALIEGAYGLNGSTPPASQHWAWTGLDAADLIHRAEAAKRAGADVVIVGMHAGEEYDSQPTEQQIRMARALTASPAIDMVYGHHAHVVQPWTRMNGKLVIYGVGNLLAQQSTRRPRAFEGVIARVTFNVKSGRATTRRAEFLPTWISSHHDGPVRVHAVNADLKAGRGDAARMRVARQQVSRTVRSLGVTGVTES